MPFSAAVDAPRRAESMKFPEGCHFRGDSTLTTVGTAGGRNSGVVGLNFPARVVPTVHGSDLRPERSSKRRLKCKCRSRPEEKV
jgi:hypothetical protein